MERLIKYSIWFFISLLILAICFLFITDIQGIEDVLLEGRNIELQTSEDLNNAEQIADQTLTKLNTGISKYHFLFDFEIENVPQNIVFTKDREQGILRIERFETRQCWGCPTYSRVFTRRIEFTFQNQVLTKIFLHIIDSDSNTRQTYISAVMDPTPLDENFNDIKVNTTGTPAGGIYNMILAKVENTISNPLRLKFKRDSYAPHLLYFYRILQRIEAINRNQAIKVEKTGIRILERSLNY
jgi:hypothetical protein